MTTTGVAIDLPGAVLNGDLTLPDEPRGVVLFAHGSGSSRHSPRNRAVAGGLVGAGLSTLLMDLLTEAEERSDAETGAFRFDIDLLASRLTRAIDWLGERAATASLRLGLFGASTGAAAALVAAAHREERVAAVVSRGGRPDLAGPALDRVRAPVLLLVGAHDPQVLQLNELAAHRLHDHALTVVPGAGHLFEEPGTLERVTEEAVDWFRRHLA
ncbi:dienelactone hydrolase family protein [Actinomadura kijaniata]|uniref:dienelactone hydrolase family protein n=1 Tax=Actinomadura kijaniata TaxID=46161 RepID=UPI00082AF267|nr:dienelactone hydrolase family protein [Actinomadura kijaniata]